MLYEEKLPRTYTRVCLALYVALVVWMGVTSLPEDFAIWLGLSVLFGAVVLLPLLGVPLSKRIYHRIRIDGHTLRVGRERLPLVWLDPDSVGAALHEAAPGTAQRYAHSAQQIDIPVSGLRARDRGNARLVGGGWSVPMGMDSVVVATRQGEGLTIATHDRTAFLTALHGALSGAQA
ncbi:hypothetical protein [Streptomyces sp. SCSIO ZS0520]|uniref:hypothetical protein n=1 Tax=Streptomyces sp. SCSIO ZS0520 TaxID=2892996 RepID=UPI0021D82557|nr:hypothetical protein [Streptomyces sp. SCSIO ZS0520]